MRFMHLGPVVLACLTVAGCSSAAKTIQVTGKVTYQGNPLPSQASVTPVFLDIDNPSQSYPAMYNASGSDLAGVPPGKYRVELPPGKYRVQARIDGRALPAWANRFNARFNTSKSPYTVDVQNNALDLNFPGP